MSYLKNLECQKCGKEYDIKKMNICSCGYPLFARYDLKKAKIEFSKNLLKARENNLWRYKELLPLKEDYNIITLGEGYTPILKSNRIGNMIGIEELYIKDEGLNPTGTFKSRGASVGVSKAKELGIKKIAMPTAGNAGGAWSAYSTKSGIKMLAVMPEDAPNINAVECSVYGAETYLMKGGLISDCGRYLARKVTEDGYFDTSTFKEPYRVEGKKTLGFEIAEQFNWVLPDVIIYPTGGGVGIVGIWKAFMELESIDWISGKKPKMVVVQSSGCAPIVKALEGRKKETETWENVTTIIGGLRVPKPIGDFLVIRAVLESGGTAVSVSDEEIFEAMHNVARYEGIMMCPEGAATIAAAKVLKDKEYIKDTDKVVLLNTGTGLKYASYFKTNYNLIEKYNND